MKIGRILLKAAGAVLLLVIAWRAASFGVEMFEKAGEKLRSAKDEAPQESQEESGEETSESVVQSRGWIIAVDAGHGGRDPGKVGANEALEKDINLAIALFLKDYLESEGVEVVMVRETDIGLYSEDASNKKREDMHNRVELINASGANAAVSIHQNSFEQSKYRGVQTFYYETSEEGKKLGEYIQNQIIRELDPENTRVAKGNTDYYLLKNTTVPFVIVECGFLSNETDSKNLTDPAYQEKMAQQIGIGLITYLEQAGE